MEKGTEREETLYKKKKYTFNDKQCIHIEWCNLKVLININSDWRNRTTSNIVRHFI